MVDSLWGDEFVLPEKPKTKKILEKVEKQKRDPKQTAEKVVKSKKISFSEKLEAIRENVYKVLGKQIDNVITIRDIDSFRDYLNKAIVKGRIAVDTETNNSLDPITCKIVGLCLYVDGEKQAYIPVNHRDPNTKIRLDNQLTEEDIKKEFINLFDKDIKYIYHNGKFDYQVLKCTCGVELPIDWDTFIAARVLDENEKSAGLKQQYIDKIDPEQEKYSIEKLFEGLLYEDFPPELFALYAATDAFMTDKLYLWQKNQFELGSNSNLYHFFKTLEMPLVKVIAEMELKGMEVDQDYAVLLSNKYHKLLDNIDSKINFELEGLKDKINAWRLTPEANFKPKLGRTKTINGVQYKYQSGSGGPGDMPYWYEVKNTRQLSRDEELALGLTLSEQKSKNEQLEDPINLGSPTQLAILFYDVLKCPQVSKKSARGTGEAELKALSEKMHLKICDLLLERREIVKLITTYIDVIPETAKVWPDGRVRTHFNQYGADTGRLSSGGRICYVDENDEQHEIGGINFQNIPSHNREIRMLFCSKPGYKIIGADYSAQEPRLTAFYSQDENMINAYKEGRDLYAVIASMSFDRKYEDCLEFYPEGTVIDYEGQKVVCGHKTHQNKEGKTYRTMAKSILLGVLYGRGAASVGEQIGKSREEAQEIIDKFFKAFPKVKKWIDESIANAHKYGYVEDIAGRRRRLPDVMLPKYQFKDLNESKNVTFNPFLECKDRVLENKLIDKYKERLNKIRNRKEYESIQSEALKEGIEIHDNTGFIAQAERQAVNSRVQGGAASLTKKALIDLYYDPKLRDMGAYLINTVHDEILIEAPDEHMREAEERLCEIMIDSAKDYINNVPMSCDGYITNCWYLDEFNALVKSEFKKLLDEKHMDPMDAFEYLCDYRSESTRDQLYELVGEFLPRMPENVKIIHTLTE